MKNIRIALITISIVAILLPMQLWAQCTPAGADL
jgi:hypothetical protein